MSTITGSAGTTINFTQASAVGVGSSVQLPILAAFKSRFAASGGALDQCDLIYAKTLTFVASTTQTLDLQTLTDVLGNAIVFARVRLVAIRVRSVTDGFVLLVGGAASDPWTGLATPGAAKVNVYPSTAQNDGFAVWQIPNTTGAVVTSSSCNLEFDPGANALGLVDVIIAGCAE